MDEIVAPPNVRFKAEMPRTSRDAADKPTDYCFGLLRASFGGAACNGRDARV